mgnify:CR=1 FL=1
MANAVPVVAANRIGVEQNDGATQSYYGHSFIADHTGRAGRRASATRTKACWSRASILPRSQRYRAEWGFFRDRRT